MEEGAIVVTLWELSSTGGAGEVLTGARRAVGNPAKGPPEPLLKVIVLRHCSALPLNQGLFHPAAFARRQCRGEALT
jgi:hypothetical protein